MFRGGHTIRRIPRWSLVLGLAIVAGCVVTTARLIPVMIDQQHPVHVTGIIHAGNCYTESSDSGDSTQCDVAVDYRTLTGVAGTAHFHHVPAGSITEYVGSAKAPRHPIANWVYSIVSYDGSPESATMPVYFTRATSTDAINPNDINSEPVYGVLLACIWLIPAFLYVQSIHAWVRRHSIDSEAR